MSDYAWKRLGKGTHTDDPESEYFQRPRRELVNLINHSPRLAVDVGCAGGALGAAVKKAYPLATVVGVENVEEAAAVARGHLDRVICESAESLDFERAGFAPKEIDLIFLADVLEHLYDPWKFLQKLRPFVADDGQVLASIPNMRNLWLLNELIEGRWTYTEAGLLDITHIRFFTFDSIVEMFRETGYSIAGFAGIIDDRVGPMSVPEGQRLTINAARITLREMSAHEVWQLGLSQFIIDAKPA
ncbi:MAG: methyltransferase domain-containing protein [Candidatus Eremiobacteraeota bacterium]|nr:methyltransferase domain-containing protein [Candidatus Eremiobacteraeota bacterium]